MSTQESFQADAKTEKEKKRVEEKVKKLIARSKRYLKKEKFSEARRYAYMAREEDPQNKEVEDLIAMIDERMFGIVEDEENSGSTRISKKDRLTIQVLEQETLTNAYTVSSDGVLEFPLIGQLKAAGLTHDELASRIKEKLEKDYFYQATVTVQPYNFGDINFRDKRSKGGVVYVYGMVDNPGVVQIPKDEVLTVSKVIIRCGGFQEFANRREVKLVRKSPLSGKAVTIKLNMVKILEKGKIEEDCVVQDDDLIIVPEQFFNF